MALKKYRYGIYYRNVDTLRDYLYARTDDAEKADELQRELLSKFYDGQTDSKYVTYIKDFKK